MTGPADVWAAAFAKPSKLWRPGPSWKPHEWTPLSVALGRIEDSFAGDIGLAEIDLHQELVSGRVGSALWYWLSDDGSKRIWLLLQPKFWQHLKITSLDRTSLLVEGDVEGRPLEMAKGFFVRTADLNKHYWGVPAAGPPGVVQLHAAGRRSGSAAVKKSSKPGSAAVWIDELCPKGEWRFMTGKQVHDGIAREAGKRELKNWPSYSAVLLELRNRRRVEAQKPQK